MIDDLVRTGRIADIALVVLALETAILLVAGRFVARAPRPLAVLATAGAGGGLLFALRGALADGGTLSVALPLTVALVAHGVESALRWQRPDDRPPPPAGP